MAENLIPFPRARALGDAVSLPKAILDDRTPEWLESQLCVPVRFAVKASDAVSWC